MKPNLIFATSLLAFLFLLGATRAAESSEEAVQVVKDHIARLKAGEIKQGFVDLWDADTMLSSAYGIMYLQLSEADRQRTQTALADFVAAPFANAKLATLFKSVEIKGTAVTIVDQNTIMVSVILSGDENKFQPPPSTLLLHRKEGKWRIIDQRQGNLPMRAALVLTYWENRKRDELLPDVLARVATEMHKKMSAAE